MRLYKEGKFVSSVAHHNESKHEAKARGEQNYQHMLEESERRALALFNQEGES